MTTLQTLAHTTAHAHGIDPDAAYDILEDYLAQADKIDGTTTDPDNIPADTADFLLEAVRQAQRAGDLGERELARLEKSHVQVTAQRDELQAYEHQRDKDIRAALAAGARVMDIVAITGLTRSRVYQIRDRA